jgi:phosphoglycolate phosphatase-like HAD superfamily hydrolase
MKELNSYKVAIFDCDGVILDSNRVKSEAFSLALSGEDATLVKEFVAYHQMNGGISRYIKFEHFYKNIKKQDNYSDALKQALARYAILSKTGLLKCVEIAGIRNVLKYFNERKIHCYVASGGDQQEVREVFEKRGLLEFFEGVFGSPLSKIENLENLHIKGNLPIPGVFFGDAYSDMQAAEEYSLDFVYISGVSEWSEGALVAQKKGFDVHQDFNEVVVDV